MKFATNVKGDLFRGKIFAVALGSRTPTNIAQKIIANGGTIFKSGKAKVDFLISNEKTMGKNTDKVQKACGSPHTRIVPPSFLNECIKQGTIVDPGSSELQKFPRTVPFRKIGKRRKPEFPIEPSVPLSLQTELRK